MFEISIVQNHFQSISTILFDDIKYIRADGDTPKIFAPLKLFKLSSSVSGDNLFLFKTNEEYKFLNLSSFHGSLLFTSIFLSLKILFSKKPHERKKLENL